MLNWLKQIFKKKKNNCCKIEIKRNTCESCVFWKSEEENNVPPAELFSKLFAKYPGEYRFCDIHKQYTHKIHSCDSFLEEKFEAQPNSTKTEEYEINHEFVVDGSNHNDINGEKK